jgi:CRISPR system Cascade subunit CasA
MIPAFNLLDEPWLPVRFTDGRLRDVGLLELFSHAGQIAYLAETSPPSLIACYRLLLAITHRALTRAQGSWKDRDRARWYREGLPEDAMRDYLEHWRERFWLFHPECPFMQVAALAMAEETRDKCKPWTQIAIGKSCGEDPVFFDHSMDHRIEPVSCEKALRELLGYLQFVVGCRTLRIGASRNEDNSDKAGPLANTAAVVPVGSTLDETLCLSLHPASLTIEDLPAWERPTVQLGDLSAGPTLATGANDRYTRLTRAVLLVPGDNGDVQWIRFAAGLALGDDVNAPDPMASYRAGSNAMVRLTFSEGRAFWRDLPALIPDAEGKASKPASVLGYSANLHAELGTLQAEQPVLIAGVASNQAKLLRWRSEQIALPAIFLQDASLGVYLREELARAENVYSQIRSISIPMYAETMPDPNHKDTHSRAREIVDAASAASVFFSELERTLPPIMTLIAGGAIDDAYGEWSQCLLHAVKDTWDVLTRNLGQTPAALRAEARAYFGYKKRKKRISGLRDLLGKLKQK